jgi:hypothetical protein
MAVTNKDRRAIFAKNLAYLCDSQRGGIEFIAEELTGIKRPDLWEKENWMLGVQDNRKQILTSAIRRLERWCKEGVVRFDKRTRQDIVKLKTIFKLSSFEDLWRGSLINELEKTEKLDEEAARKKSWNEEESAREKSWNEDMAMPLNGSLFGRDENNWAHKVSKISYWYKQQKREKELEGLYSWIHQHWDKLPLEWRSKY